MVYFQAIDPTALKPVRQANLGHEIRGMCVSKQWMLVTDFYYVGTIRVYSLPDLQLRKRVQVDSHAGNHLRTDSEGRVYIVYVSDAPYISMLEISDDGDVTVLGNLTVQGKLQGTIRVAVGPQPGQLCAGHFLHVHVYIVNITGDSILHTLVVPPEIEGIHEVAALSTGEVLVADAGGHLAWYPSVSEPAIMLTDTLVTGWLIMLGNIHQFLVATLKGSQLYVVDRKRTWHTLESLNGGEGVWIPEIIDVTVWENCMWVAQEIGDLILLCPV